MHKLPETLRENVRMLGDLLGQVIAAHEGQQLFDKVEQIRSISKKLAHSDEANYRPLVDSLGELSDADILPLTRAFNQFLNLANIADQQYYSSAEVQPQDSLRQLVKSFEETTDKSKLLACMRSLNIDLVLTAHPTEVSRRTLIRKYQQLIKTLHDISRDDLLEYQQDKLQGRLYRLIEEIWTTDEIRVQRPTAVDEARGGFSVIEDSLWQAVPDFIRHFDRVSYQQLGEHLTLDARPFTFCSWMGGDRDGNPNVTHRVTEQVILLGRARAADLYLKDIDSLAADLSLHSASTKLREALSDSNSATPYRDLLSQLKARLIRTRDWANARFDGDTVATPEDLITSRDHILAPLFARLRFTGRAGLPEHRKRPFDRYHTPRSRLWHQSQPCRCAPGCRSPRASTG